MIFSRILRNSHLGNHSKIFQEFLTGARLENPLRVYSWSTLSFPSVIISGVFCRFYKKLLQGFLRLRFWGILHEHIPEFLLDLLRIIPRFTMSFLWDFSKSSFWDSSPAGIFFWDSCRSSYWDSSWFRSYDSYRNFFTGFFRNTLWDFFRTIFCYKSGDVSAISPGILYEIHLEVLSVSHLTNASKIHPGALCGISQ